MGRPVVQPITWCTWVEVVKIGRHDEPVLTSYTFYYFKTKFNC